MDLTIPLENNTFNVRVAVLIQKDGGFILEEKTEGGYCFPIGGRIKSGETSEEATKREVFEELGIIVDACHLKAVVELFFSEQDNNFQEICFVYTAKHVDDFILPQGFKSYTLEEIETIDFRPQIIKEVMRSNNQDILHLHVRESS